MCTVRDSNCSLAGNGPQANACAIGQQLLLSELDNSIGATSNCSLSYSYAPHPKAPLCKGGCQKSLIFDWGIAPAQDEFAER